MICYTDFVSNFQNLLIWDSMSHVTFTYDGEIKQSCRQKIPQYQYKKERI